MRRTKEISLKEAIAEFLEKNKLNRRLEQTEIFERWNTVLGPTIANRTTHITMRGKTLFVTLSSSALRQELSMSQTLILKSLNEGMSHDVVEKIVFK
jgi:predicted nucleic acid-binding Zn ribbon protein